MGPNFFSFLNILFMHQNCNLRDFPGGPVAKIVHSQCRVLVQPNKQISKNLHLNVNPLEKFLASPHNQKPLSLY